MKYLLLLLVAGCSTVGDYGATAVAERRQMNDLQLQGTTAALCDVSVGAYVRAPEKAQRAIEAYCGVAEPRVVFIPDTTP